MAERMLRDWTQSEAVNALSAEAEVFFTRLIMKADDFGNYVGHPKLLRAALYPLRDGMKDARIDSLIAECESCGVVKSYTVDGKRYIHIPNYGQRMRTMRGKYPAPDGNLPTNVRNLPTNAGEEKRREEKIEVEVEGEVEWKEKTRSWFESCIDEIYKETLTMTYKGKNIDQAIAEAWTHLSAEPQRLKVIDSGGVKKLVNTWLSNMKEQKAETKKKNWKL